MKTPEERKALLEIEVVKQIKNGWTTTDRTEFGCQLRKKKNIDGCTVAILIVLFVIPGILYLIFMSGKTMTVFIEVDEEGIITYCSKDVPRSFIERVNYNANKK
jgi:hypothetical protein